MHEDKILVLDFGSQYTQLIARRIREQRVYSVVHPFDYPLEKIRETIAEDTPPPIAPAEVICSSMMSGNTSASPASGTVPRRPTK